jgi:uncharacterized protein
MIDAADRQSVDGICGKLLGEERIPIFVVTIRSMLDYGAAGHTIEQYARELFDHWGIGSEQRNYGILLLVSRGDREARIELGAGWGGTHDSQSAQIMDELIIREFKRGNFSLGILQGVRGLDAMARGLGLPKPRVPWWHMALFIGGIALTIGVIVSLFRNGRSGWGWALIIGLGALLFFVLRSAASSRGSSGGFGGGFSGGGGASGSW